MRKRITSKVDINAIGIEIKENQDRKRQLFRNALRDVCYRDNVRISEAKKTLRMELKWACIKRTVSIYCNESSVVLAK